MSIRNSDYKHVAYSVRRNTTSCAAQVVQATAHKINTQCPDKETDLWQELITWRRAPCPTMTWCFQWHRCLVWCAKNWIRYFHLKQQKTFSSLDSLSTAPDTSMYKYIPNIKLTILFIKVRDISLYLKKGLKMCDLIKYWIQNHFSSGL